MWDPHPLRGRCGPGGQDGRPDVLMVLLLLFFFRGEVSRRGLRMTGKSDGGNNIWYATTTPRREDFTVARARAIATSLRSCSYYVVVVEDDELASQIAFDICPWGAAVGESKSLFG